MCQIIFYGVLGRLGHTLSDTLVVAPLTGDTPEEIFGVLLLKIASRAGLR